MSIGYGAPVPEQSGPTYIHTSPLGAAVQDARQLFERRAIAAGVGPLDAERIANSVYVTYSRAMDHLDYRATQEVVTPAHEAALQSAEPVLLTAIWAWIALVAAERSVYATQARLRAERAAAVRAEQLAIEADLDARALAAHGKPYRSCTRRQRDAISDAVSCGETRAPDDVEAARRAANPFAALRA